MAPKKKLTKKELDRKRKEEEDRKIQEEEEARLKAEHEEKERIQREKIEAEEMKKVEKQELKKRSAELEDFRALQATHQDKLDEDEKNRRLQYSWERYLRCDGSPDPSIPQEINTYINLWREDEKNITIEPIMNEGLLCLRLIQELEFLIEDYSKENGFANQISKYEETIKELQILLQEKIDRASLEMLSQATKLAESETSNLEKMWKYEKMILCLWGNLTKNPRVTKFDFPDIGINISIPKVLILSDIAFRILYTKYDHCSSDCKYFRPRQKIIEKIDLIESVVENPVEVEGDKEKESERNSDIPKDDIDLMDELNKVEDNDEVENEVVIEQEEEIDPPIEDLIPLPSIIEWEDFDGDEDVIDLRNFCPVGGLFHINMVCLPPQPKIASGWTMTQQVVPPKLTPFSYQFSTDEIKELKKTSTVEVVEKESQGGSKERSTIPKPIIVTIKLPEDVIIAEEPHLALWDSKLNEWKTEYLILSSYKEEEKLITFQILSFGVVGIFQDFHINMPFQSWILKPFRISKIDASSKKAKHSDEASNDMKNKTSDELSEHNEILEELDFDQDSKNQCLLTINAAVFDVKLHICDNKIRILYDEDHTELNGLANKWLSVSELIKVMRSAGINVFPREDSEKYVSITEKNAVAEKMLYDQMALLSPSVAFGWSRWNAECKNSDTCIILASEHLNYERAVNEDDWSVLSFTRKKVEKLKLKEFDEKFSTEVDDRIAFHSNLHHFYQDFGTEEGMVAVKNIDSHYFNTVRSLLKSIRPVVFS